MKYFTASDDYAVATTQDMDPLRPGGRLAPGLIKAMVNVYEPGDGCEPHPSLPTLRQLISQHTDEATGLLAFTAPGSARPGYPGLMLKFDPAPLRDIPPDWRASYGCSFVTLEALKSAPPNPAP